MSGELAPGEQLPSTQHLVQRYGAANATIQRALATLKDEGFVYSRVGKGVYVRDKQPFVVQVAAYLAPTPKGYSYRLLEVSQVRPPAEISEALDLARNDMAVMRNRLLLHDGDPVELSWSYYPAEIAVRSPLAARNKISGGAPQALAALGYPQRDFVDRLSARAPTTEELQALELPDDVPVIRQLRIIYTDDHRPVEASILIKGAHLYELSYQQTIH